MSSDRTLPCPAPGIRGRQENSSWEKRRHPRFGCSGTAEVQFSPQDDPLAARVLNLSDAGCRLMVQQPHGAEVGDTVEIAFEVNQLPFRVRAEIKVVVSRVTIGVEFLGLSRRSSQRIQDLVDELAEARGLTVSPARAYSARLQ